MATTSDPDDLDESVVVVYNSSTRRSIPIIDLDSNSDSEVTPVKQNVDKLKTVPNRPQHGKIQGKEQEKNQVQQEKQPQQDIDRQRTTKDTICHSEQELADVVQRDQTYFYIDKNPTPTAVSGRKGKSKQRRNAKKRRKRKEMQNCRKILGTCKQPDGKKQANNRQENINNCKQRKRSVSGGQCRNQPAQKRQKVNEPVNGGSNTPRSHLPMPPMPPHNLIQTTPFKQIAPVENSLATRSEDQIASTRPIGSKAKINSKQKNPYVDRGSVRVTFSNSTATNAGQRKHRNVTYFPNQCISTGNQSVKPVASVNPMETIVPQPVVTILSSTTVPLSTTAPSFTTVPQLITLPPTLGLGRLRPVAIDGSNVAYAHGKDQLFSCKGIKICVEYFLSRGHETVKAFVPQYRRNNSLYSDCHILEDLAKGLQHVVFTPSRRVSNKLICPYDDRFILEYASRVGAVVVSNDNYRDLLNENPSFRETIEKRLLMYTFVDDIFMIAQDPMGRYGPNLDVFMRFPVSENK